LQHKVKVKFAWKKVLIPLPFWERIKVSNHTINNSTLGFGAWGWVHAIEKMVEDGKLMEI
jgi:hypothetical protein